MDTESTSQRVARHVAPFHKRNTAGAKQLGYSKICNFARALESVEIGVMHGQAAALVSVQQVERRRRNRFGHAKGSAKTLREVCLTCSHFANECDQVARTHERGNALCDALGVKRVGGS
jgi:hypothetical protein